MSLLDLFGINKEVSPSDVVRNAPEIESKIEQTNKALQDILNENPDLVNNLQTNLAPVGPMKIETPISKAYDFLMQGRVTNPFDTTNKLGILDLVNTGRFFSNPTLTSGIFSPFAPLAIKGITSLVSNIKDPYKSAFGGLNKATREAINRESVRDLQDRIDKGQFGATTPTPQDAARGDKGSRSGGRSAGFDQAERGGPQGR